MQKMMSNKSKKSCQIICRKTKETPVTQHRMVYSVTSVKKEEENKPIEKGKMDKNHIDKDKEH